MFAIPPREERPAAAFQLFMIILSTTCFILSIFSTLSCNFVKRSVELDPGVRYVLPYELEQRLVFHDLAGFTGIGMGFWSYSAWGGGHDGEGACYPYHLCFLDGSYNEPPKNAGIGSARTFAAMANIMGGVGMTFLWFAALFRVSPLRYTRPVGSVMWMACLCQAWTLVLMTRSTVCGPDFFSYCLPQSYQSEEYAKNSKCQLERGANIAIASTVLWFICSISMCIRPWFDCLGDKGARVGQEDLSNHSRGRQSRRTSAASRRSRSRSNESALAKIMAAAEAAEKEEEVAKKDIRSKSYNDRRRSRSSDTALVRLAKAAEIEEDLAEQGKGNNRRKSGFTEKSWGV